jgi:hypothetical protein
MDLIIRNMEFPKLEHHTLLRGLTPPPEYFTRPHKIYRSSYVELKPLEFEPMEPIQLLAIDKDVFKILDGRREWKQAAQVNENTGNSNSAGKNSKFAIPFFESKFFPETICPLKPLTFLSTCVCRI